MALFAVFSCKCFIFLNSSSLRFWPSRGARSETRWPVLSTGWGTPEVKETKTQAQGTGRSRDEHGRRWKPAEDPSPLLFGWSLWHNLRDTHSLRSEKGTNPSGRQTLTSISLVFQESMKANMFFSEHFYGVIQSNVSTRFYRVIQSTISTAWHSQKTRANHGGMASPSQHSQWKGKISSSQFTSCYTGNDDYYYL